MTSYEAWMPGVAQYPNSEILANSLQQNLPAKAIAHITADRTASASRPLPHVPFESLLSYFRNGGASVAPHILWCPFTGKFAQFFPAWSRSLSVMNGPSGQQTNRMGKFVIQIEAVFFPYCDYNGKVYEKLSETPCSGWDSLHTWVKSLGIPDVWPDGIPKGSGDSRSLTNWDKDAGWYGHSQVPWNDHIDPLSWPAFPAAAKPPVKPEPKPEPKPPVTPTPKPVTPTESTIIAELKSELATIETQLNELTTDEKSG